MWKTVSDFVTIPVDDAREVYRLGKDARDWKVEFAQRDLRRTGGPKRKRVVPVLYRPFDKRFTYFTGNSRGFLCMPRGGVMRHMLAGDNRGLVSTRSIEIGRFEHVFCANGIIGHHSLSLKEVNYLHPLWLVPRTDAPKGLLKVDDRRQPNLGAPFLRALADSLSLMQVGTTRLPDGISPEDILHYTYAILHSPAYRTRYAEFLKIDFPHLPLPGGLDLFRRLARLGDELVALHLMESPRLDDFITTYRGPNDPEVRRVGWSDGTVWLDAGKTTARDGHRATQPGTIGFRGVHEAVWDLQIGGYQVCHRWLKDRKGRTLTDGDLAHYQKIVVALNETIRIMAEIDAVIEEHGGWPGAFQTAEPIEEPERQLPMVAEPKTEYDASVSKGKKR
jgi:hypothetical protein